MLSSFYALPAHKRDIYHFFAAASYNSWGNVPYDYYLFFRLNSYQSPKWHVRRIFYGHLLLPLKFSQNQMFILYDLINFQMKMNILMLKINSATFLLYGQDHVQVFWKHKSIGNQASDWLTHQVNQSEAWFPIDLCFQNTCT